MQMDHVQRCKMFVFRFAYSITLLHNRTTCLFSILQILTDLRSHLSAMQNVCFQGCNINFNSTHGLFLGWNLPTIFFQPRRGAPRVDRPVGCVSCWCTAAADGVERSLRLLQSNRVQYSYRLTVPGTDGAAILQFRMQEMPPTIVVVEVHSTSKLGGVSKTSN